jgi:hypothetical protein
MKSHTDFLELAAAAIDFPLRPEERRRLDEHLTTCAACAAVASAMRRDAAQFASIQVIALSDQRQAALLRSALRPPGTHVVRLVAIAALLGLLLTGSLIVGAQLLRQPEDALLVFVPVPTATGTASPVESATPTPTPDPTPAPTPSPSSLPATAPPAPRENEAATPAVVLQPPDEISDSVPIATDAFGVVVTSDLRVRSRPEVSAASERLSPLLQEGQDVFVVDGPVSGSGYEWYLVAPIGGYEANGLPFGWVAAADKNGDSWLGSGSVDCPDVPDSFASFIPLVPIGEPAAVALTCFGDQSISFPARLIRPEATCGADPGWTIEPQWLGGTCSHPEFLFIDPSGAPSDSRDAVVAPGVDTSRFDPGVDPAAGTDVLLTGQWDHPDARDCEPVVTQSGQEPEISTEEAVLTCRSQFVITRIDPV